MFKYLIVGGGLHGYYFANILIHKAGLSPDGVKVIDPWEIPFFRWISHTRNTNMRFMRSTSVHHLDLAPDSLRRFAAREAGKNPEFDPPYKRPSLSLFTDHCRATLKKRGLEKLRIQGTVSDLRVLPRGGVRAETDRGELKAERVILAMGSGDYPHYPHWARSFKERHPQFIDHIFDQGFDLKKLDPEKKVCVIGGGISAVHLTLSLCRSQKQSPTMFYKEPLSSFRFDSDPGWLNKFLPGFFKEPDLRKRLGILNQARKGGSVPPALLHQLFFKERAGLLEIRKTKIFSLTQKENRVFPELFTGERQGFDLILLATGFDFPRPLWLRNLALRENLPCLETGHCMTDESLHWGKGIYAAGALGELNIGPAARNIVGARLAGERLLATVS